MGFHFQSEFAAAKLNHRTFSHSTQGRPRPSRKLRESPQNATPEICTAKSGHRFYSPELGRWLSRDPMEEYGGINIYDVFYNNILVSLDVLGLGTFGVTKTWITPKHEDEEKMRDYDIPHLGWSAYQVVYYPDVGECMGAMRITQVVKQWVRYGVFWNERQSLDNGNSKEEESKEMPPWAANLAWRVVVDRKNGAPPGVGFTDAPRTAEKMPVDREWKTAEIVPICCQGTKWRALASLTIMFNRATEELKVRDADGQWKVVGEEKEVMFNGDKIPSKTWDKYLEPWKQSRQP